jgi:autotransporter-associated beta strand protein
MRSNKKLLAAATAGVISVFANSGKAQQIDYFGQTYNQSFDTLPMSGSVGTVLSTAVPLDLTQPIPNGIGAGQFLNGWYASTFKGKGTAIDPIKFYTTDGSDVMGSIGALGSFGLTGDFDRALGSLSNTGGEIRFGAKFVNDSDTAYSSFTINYDVEQWTRESTTIDFLNRLEYSVGATNLNTGNFTVIGPTDQLQRGGTWNGVVAGGPNTVLNGNEAANHVHKTFTINGINWAPGQSLVLRWNDVNDAGTEAALAIDNFSFLAAAAGHQLSWQGTPDGTWDTNSGNKPWLNGAVASAFVPDDVVTFGATLNNVAINVNAGGVGPSSTTISNPVNKYSFAGGPISGVLNKTETGTAVFTSSNNFSEVHIDGGHVELQTNNALGFSSTVSLGDASIDITTSDHDFSSALLLTGNGTINTSVGLNISGSVNGSAGTSLTINNTSATPVALPNLNNLPSQFNGNFHVAAGVVKYSGSNDGDIFAPATIVTVDAGATLDFGVNGDSFGGIQGGGNIILTDTPGSFLNLQAAGDRTFSGIISGTTTNATSQGLHQQGGGVLTLTGQSTFKAPTTISYGTIVVGGNVLPDTDGPLGNSSSTIQLGDGGTSTSNVVGLEIAGPFEIARNIAIAPNTNPVAITLGGTTDDNSVFSGQIDMGKSSILTSVTTGGRAVTFSGPILASGTSAHGLTKTGPGLVILASPNNSFLNPVTINAGTLRVTGSIATSAGVNVNATGTFEAGATQTVQKLTINAGGVARITDGVLTVGGNSTNNGILDVTTRGLIVDYPVGNEALALQTIRAAIISGYNGGDWAGNGITSSAITTNNRAIGYAQSTEITLGPGNTFMDSPVDDSAILVRYTITGDANMDGTIGFADLVAVAQHYGINDGSATWVEGDSNYDGNVSFADLVAVAQSYGGALPSSAIAGAPVNFAGDMAAAFASVPEPSAIALIAIGAAGMLRRRRRA